MYIEERQANLERSVKRIEEKVDANAVILNELNELLEYLKTEASQTEVDQKEYALSIMKSDLEDLSREDLIGIAVKCPEYFTTVSRDAIWEYTKRGKVHPVYERYKHLERSNCAEGDIINLFVLKELYDEYEKEKLNDFKIALKDAFFPKAFEYIPPYMDMPIYPYHPDIYPPYWTGTAAPTPWPDYYTLT